MLFETFALLGGVAILYKLVSTSGNQSKEESPQFKFKSLEEYKKIIQGYREIKTNNALKKNKFFFDGLFDYPLTHEQRTAVVSESNSSLVLASAGSGKTSTLLGKYFYLIKQQKISADKILILSFDNVVQKDITKKIKPFNIKPVTKTFHALGNMIIESKTGHKKAFGKIAQEDKENLLVTENIKTCIERAKSSHPNIGYLLLEFRALCPFHRIETFANSIEEYNSAISTYPYVREKYRTGDDDRSLTIPSLQPGVYVRSQEELTIANFLYLNSVDFEYEKGFDRAVDISSEHDGRPYHPDFYYPEVDLWHEHFALDQNGKAPKSFEGYEDEVKIKKEIHKNAKSNFIYSLSADFKTGEILLKLANVLADQGIILKPRETEEIEKRLDTIYFDELHKLIRDVIKLQKGSDLSIDNAIQKIDALDDQFRAKKFKLIYIPIFEAYQEILKEKDELDFEDMINSATKILNEEGLESKHSSSFESFAWVLIDEFQDISYCRAKFLTALRDNGYFGGAKIFAVGDDWQSIYAFAGSDLSQLHDFHDNFYLANTVFHIDKNGTSEKVWFPEQYADDQTLRKTYNSMIHYANINSQIDPDKILDKENQRFLITANHRNDESISQLTSQFIQKNPSQIKKQITALNSYYKDKQNYAFNVCKCDQYSETEIEKIILKIPKNSSIRILARENRQIEKINIGNILTKFPDYVIEKSSIHGAKGLECDYVIILGLEGGFNGFPKKKEDDPIKKIFKSISDQYPDAEERRVFYVAMSRAKYGVYICHKATSKSEFINEISKLGSNLQIPINKFNFSFATKECPICLLNGRAGTLSPQVNFRKVQANPNTNPRIFLTCNFSRKNKDALNCNYKPDFNSHVDCFLCNEDALEGKLYVKDIMGNLFVCCTNNSCTLKIDFFNFKVTALVEKNKSPKQIS